MRTFLIIVVIILIGLYLAYLYVKKGWDKVSFKVYFKSADLQGITLQSLATSVLTGGQKINVVIGADIKNDNNYPLVFSGLKVLMSYKSNVIAETSEQLSNKKFIVPANGTLSIEDNSTLTITTSSLGILKEKLAGNSPQIDYAVKVNVYGISLPLVKGNFNW